MTICLCTKQNDQNQNPTFVATTGVTVTGNMTAEQNGKSLLFAKFNVLLCIFVDLVTLMKLFIKISIMASNPI